MKYGIVYADPPWKYDDACLHRGGALRHYNTMSIEDICAMPVKDLAADNCALFVWGTWPKLAECLQLITAWGFTFKTCAFVWVKTTAGGEVNQSRLFPDDAFKSAWGMGRWTRSNSEFCLLGIKGSPKRISASVHQIVYEPVQEHSRKPPIVRDKIIELIGDLPRIELFARENTIGWHVFGNQVETTPGLVIA